MIISHTISMFKRFEHLFTVKKHFSRELSFTMKIGMFKVLGLLILLIALTRCTQVIRFSKEHNVTNGTSASNVRLRTSNPGSKTSPWRTLESIKTYGCLTYRCIWVQYIEKKKFRGRIRIFFIWYLLSQLILSLLQRRGQQLTPFLMDLQEWY